MLTMLSIMENEVFCGSSVVCIFLHTKNSDLGKSLNIGHVGLIHIPDTTATACELKHPCPSWSLFADLQVTVDFLVKIDINSMSNPATFAEANHLVLNTLFKQNQYIM